MSRPKHRGIVTLHPSLKIPDEDIQRLRDAGYIPIRGENAQVFVQPPPLARMDGGELTVAALKTLAVNSDRHRDFGRLMLTNVLAQVGLLLNPNNTVSEAPRRP